MSEYLNKIGLLKYNNTTYKQIDQIQYYSIRSPQLVSSDPRINFFNYPWKSDGHWSYNNFGQGWYYNGKDEIAYTVNITDINSFNPTHKTEMDKIVSKGFLYNVIPIQQFLLSSISANLLTSNLFENPRPLYYLKTTNGQLLRLQYNNDYRAYEDIEKSDKYTYVVDDDNHPQLKGKNLVLDWIPSDVSEYQASEDIHSDISTIVSGYWLSGADISGILYSQPKLYQGNVKDIYSNELFFNVLSPNLSNLDVTEYYYDRNGNYIGTKNQIDITLIPIQSTYLYHPPDHVSLPDIECPVWKSGEEEYVSYIIDNIEWFYNPNKQPGENGYFIGSNLNLIPKQATLKFHPFGEPEDKDCLIYQDEQNNQYICYQKNTLSFNEVSGLFYNLPGTDYITGICTVKMLFIDAQQQSEKQYVYMRGLFKGNIEVVNGILQNEIAPPSTIIKKIKVKQLQGTLKNITELPEEIKYGLKYYNAWGWLHGIDNIKYENIWYKNEISGTLNSTSKINYSQIDIYNNRYIGTLSVPIITNNIEEDVTNVLTGIFFKEEKSNIITGYMEGTIEPYDIKMKGYLTGYYNTISNNVLKPLQLSGILFNKSAINQNLRSILDIKYANTLGRKGLTYLDPLHGKRLNFATKNYDPYNKPYMLQSWKIIEYKTSEKEKDYKNEIPNENTIDLNTYIVDNKYLKYNFKSKIYKTTSQLNELIGDNNFYVYWNREEQYGDFVIRCVSGIIPQNVNNTIHFTNIVNAQKYIKHICGQSNLKLKTYETSIIKDQRDNIKSYITSYVLDSSDLEIK